MKDIHCYEDYFQGLFDGDGSYGYYTSPSLYLATSLDVDYEKLIDFLPLVPTATAHNRKNLISYSKRNGNSVYFIRFAPQSLKHMHKKYTASDVVKQLDFMIDSTHNSIRPDKVYKLITIIEEITSKDYDENTNSIHLQKEIRDLAVKSKLNKKLEHLRLRYSIKDNKYQPFIPKWAEDICSKNEAWDFFFNKENLVFKIRNKLIDIDFSEGVPINFEF